MSDNSDLVDNAKQELETILDSTSVPFLKTCPVCNDPLREGKKICVLLESVDSVQFTDPTYYCPTHIPDVDEYDKLLSGYIVSICFTLTESGSQREISIEEIDSKRPDSYDAL